jgi:hypothetical protein
MYPFWINIGSSNKSNGLNCILKGKINRQCGKILIKRLKNG